MENQELEQLRYPIGKYQKPHIITQDHLNQYLIDIEELPEKLGIAVANLSHQQLDTPYRPRGWTVRQVVHHIPDSHLNSYIRFKWTLTEDNPTIKAYFEERWAELPDSRETPVEVSLHLLDGLHKRWIILLRSLSPQQLKRKFVHSETDRSIQLDENIGLYAWHGNHHLAHITSLRKRMGW